MLGWEPLSCQLWTQGWKRHTIGNEPLAPLDDDGNFVSRRQVLPEHRNRVVSRYCSVQGIDSIFRLVLIRKLNSGPDRLDSLQHGR